MNEVIVQISRPEVGQNCDIFPFLSIHKAKVNSKGEYWVSKTHMIPFPVMELKEAPETKHCPECGASFPKDTTFIADKKFGEICLRSYEKLNHVDRDNYRAALMKEIAQCPTE